MAPPTPCSTPGRPHARSIPGSPSLASSPSRPPDDTQEMRRSVPKDRSLGNYFLLPFALVSLTSPQAPQLTASALTYLAEAVLGGPGGQHVRVVIGIEVGEVQVLQLLQGRCAICPGRKGGQGGEDTRFYSLGIRIRKQPRKDTLSTFPSRRIEENIQIHISQVQKEMCKAI